MRVGSKINSFLNGEWAKHARPFGKKRAASKRRVIDKKEIQSYKYDGREEASSTPGKLPGHSKSFFD